MAANTSTKKLVNELEKAVDSSKKLLKVFEDTQDVTKDVAKDLEKAFKGVDKKTSKGIAELNKLLAQTNKLTEQSEQLIKAKKDTESDLIKVEKRLSAARVAEIKEQQELHKLEQLRNKTLREVQKEKERQRKTFKKTQDAYQKESALLRKMKNDLKATTIELRRMGKSEKEVAKATKAAAKEINKLDRELRDLDKSVGDSFREIGKYENALNDLKDTASGAGAALAGVGVGLVLDNLTNSIEQSRLAQLELDKGLSKVRATGKVVGSELTQSVLESGSNLSSMLEISNKITSNANDLTIAQTALLAKRLFLSDKEIKTRETEIEQIKERSIELVKEQQLLINSRKQKKKEKENSPETLDAINETSTALENLYDQTLKADIANNSLTVSLSLLVKEQEELRAISDDDTRSLNEAIEAKIKLTEQNKLVAETQEEIAANDLKIQTLNIGAELLAKKKITLDQALNLTSKEANDLLKDQGNLLALSTESARAFTDATVNYNAARTESSTTALETEEKLAKLYSDKLEKDLDILIDGADKIKMINEKIVADDTISNKHRQELLDETKLLIENSYKEQTKTISDFANKRIDMNSQLSDDEKKALKEKVKASDIEELLAIKDAKLLNERIRQLGLSEIFEGRTLEVFKEKIQANQDFVDSQKGVNKAVAKTNEINEDILDQEEQLAILRDKEIDTQKELDDAQEKAEAAKIENRIDAIDAELKLIEKGSLEEATLNQEKNDLLLQQETKAAEARIKKTEEEADKKKEIEEKSLETRKKLIEDGITVTETLLANARSKQNEELDKEIDALETRIDDVKNAIENGNVNASQSLAELERKRAEAEKEKEELRKKEIRDKKIIAGLELLTANNGNVPKTLGDISILMASLSQLDSFFDGTEDTGTVQNPLDSNGGRTAILHDNERVMTAKQNQKLGGISNEDLADLGQMHNTGNLGGTTVLQTNNDNLVREVTKVVRAIESQPVQSYNYDAKRSYHEQVLTSKNKREVIKIKANNLFK